ARGRAYAGGAPAHGPPTRPGAGPLPVGAGRAITAHAHHPQAGVAHGELVVRALPAFERGTREVLDQYVGSLDEPVQDVAPAVGIELECDRSLIACDQRPHERAPVALRSHGTQRITLPRLDLHDVGAEVAEHSCDLWSREQRRDVEDAQPVEGTTVHALRRAWSRPWWARSCATRTRAGCRDRRTP